MKNLIQLFFLSIVLISIQVSSEELVVIEKSKQINPRLYWIEEEESYEYCESGYYCPGNRKKYECPDGTYSRENEKICEKCGCTISDDCWIRRIFERNFPKKNLIRKFFE